MKNIFTLIYILVFVAAGVSYAQEGNSGNGKIFIFNNANEFCALKAEGIKYDSAKNIYSVGFIKNKVVAKIKKNGIFFSGDGTTVYNDFTRYTFDNNFKPLGVSNEKYSKNGTGAELLDTLITKNPDFFNHKSDKVYSFQNDIYGTNAITYEYDNTINEYVKSNAKPVMIKVDNKPEADMLASLIMENSEDNGTVTTYFEKKGEQKYSELKDLEFVTYNLSGKAIHSCHVIFNYPREFIISGNVHEKNNFLHSAGKAFFFSKANLLFGAKKYGDPENNNFEIVYCDQNGKGILHKTFTIKLEKKTQLKIYYMFGDTSSISVLAGYSGSSDIGVVMMNFTKYGKGTVVLNSKQLFKTKMILDPNVKRPEETFDNPFGISIGSDDNFVVSGHSLLSNGNILIWGITSHLMNDPNFKRKPGNMSSDVPKILYYQDFVCLHFNDTLGLNSMFVSTLNHTTDIPSVEAYILNNNEFLFATANAIRKATAEEMNIREIASMVSDQKYQYGYKSMFSPRLIKINLAAQEIREYNSNIKEFNLFRPVKYSCIDPDKKSVSIFGYNIKNEKMELLLEKIIF